MAVLGETLTDLLDPWPLKVIVDNVLRPMNHPDRLGGFVIAHFGYHAHVILVVAVCAVAVIAIVGAIVGALLSRG